MIRDDRHATYGIGQRTDRFSGAISLQQRVLPEYRVPFFNALADACNGLAVAAGEPLADEAIGMDIDKKRLAFTSYFLRNKYFHWPGLRSGVCWQRGLKGWFDSTSPDILVLEANPRLLSNHRILRLAQNMGCPTIGWGLGIRKPLGFVGEHALHDFLKRFDALIAYSSAGAASFEKHGVEGHRIFVARNAVSGAHIKSAKRALKEHPCLLEHYRRLLSSRGNPIVLYVGRLVRAKKTDLLIKASAQQTGAYEVVIIGEGPDKERLMNLADKYSSPVTFLGRKTGVDLALCILASDVVVVPGPGGLVLVEALLCGKPVIAAEADGSADEIIIEGETGFRVPSDDVTALRRTVQFALSDPQALRVMGSNAGTSASSTYNLETMVATFIKAFQFVSRS